MREPARSSKARKLIHGWRPISAVNQPAWFAIWRSEHRGRRPRQDTRGSQSSAEQPALHAEETGEEDEPEERHPDGDHEMVGLEDGGHDSASSSGESRRVPQASRRGVVLQQEFVGGSCFNPGTGFCNIVRDEKLSEAGNFQGVRGLGCCIHAGRRQQEPRPGFRKDPPWRPASRAGSSTRRWR